MDETVVTIPAPVVEPPIPATTTEKGAAVVVEKKNGVSTPALEMDNVSQSEDGSLVWTLDPNDPDSTVYKGKSLRELMANIAKGKLEADRTIRETQLREKTYSASKKYKGAGANADRAPDTQSEADDLEVEWPNQEKIYTDSFKKFGVDEDLNSWTKAKWKEYEDENGGLAAMELKQQFNRAKEAAQGEIASGNAAALNDIILNEETNEVIRLVSEEKIDPGKFDFDAVLRRVYSDKESYTRQGTLRQGRITAEAARALSKLKRSSIEQSVNEEVAKGVKAKESIPGSAKTAAAFQTASKVPKTTAEAMRMALEEFRSQQKQ